MVLDNTDVGARTTTLQRAIPVLLCSVCSLCSVVPALAQVVVNLDLGVGGFVSIPGASEPCGDVLLNADGRVEAGYAWQGEGVQEPYYGAFAECYSGEAAVCAVFFDFSQVSESQSGQTMDVFVWDDANGEPGAILAVVSDVDPGPIASWPDFSRHSVTVPELPCTESAWWVGYWGDWPGESYGWAIGADLDGPGGCPLTNIAPGIGLPSGWQNVSVVWGPTTALDIGAEVLECSPTPIVTSSWGRVRALYSRD